MTLSIVREDTVSDLFFKHEQHEHTYSHSLASVFCDYVHNFIIISICETNAKHSILMIVKDLFELPL